MWKSERSDLSAGLPGVFVGRRSELSRFAESAGQIRLAVIYGPAGVGKTALMLRAAAELARTLSARVVHHVCRAGENLSTVAASLRARRGLIAMAREQPLVLCLDDVHKADNRALIDEVVGLAAGGHPIWVCLASREVLPLSTETIDHLLIRLDGLAGDEALELWATLERLYGAASVSFESAAPRIGGSPLRLKQAFAGPFETRRQDPLEIASLPELDRALLRDVAAFRRPAPFAALVEGRDDAAVRESLLRLARRFMIDLEPDGGAAMHDLVREAVCAVDAPGRAEHARCLRHTSDEFEALHHAVHCGEDERALSLLERHTTHLARVLPASAVVERELARALDELAQRRTLVPSLRLLRARLRAHQGQLAQASSEIAALASCGDPMVDLDLGETACLSGRMRDALAPLERAVADLRLEFPARLWARVLLIDALRNLSELDACQRVLAEAQPDLAMAATFGDGLRVFLEALLARDREAYARSAEALAESQRAFELCVEALAYLPLAVPPDALVERAATALASFARMIAAAHGRPSDQPAAPEIFFHDTVFFRLLSRTLEAEQQLLAGEARDAARVADAVQYDAQAHGFAVLEAWSTWVWARAQLALGHPLDALERIVPRLRACDRLGLSHAARQLRAAEAEARLLHGQATLAGALAREGLEHAPQQGTRARLHAIAAVADAAMGQSGAPRLTMRAQGHDRASARLDRVEAQLWCGRVAHARSEASEVAGEAARAAWAHLACRAGVLEAEAAFRVGDYQAARACWAEAAERARRDGFAACEARAALIGAALARLQGDRAECDKRLSACVTLARAAGLPVEAEAASACLSVSRGAARPPESLATRLADRFELLDPIVCRCRRRDGAHWLTARQARHFAEAERMPVFDLVSGQVRLGRRAADLSRRPALLAVLGALADVPGFAVPVGAMVQRAWGIEYHPLRHRSRVVMAIARLRELLGPRAIVARESGYSLAAGDSWVVIEPACV
jgi:hypothetical protein